MSHERNTYRNQDYPNRDERGRIMSKAAIESEHVADNERRDQMREIGDRLFGDGTPNSGNRGLQDWCRDRM